MSNTILGGNFTVYYLDETRQKRIRWTGSASGTNTMNQLYSALQDLFDESVQMDDGVPMSAQTPVEYTIGKIDSGDAEPWYIDYETMEHLTGGALKTSGWTRVEGTNTGIVVAKVAAAGRTIVPGDVGLSITHADGDAGTLLEVIDTGGASDYLIIRPNTSAIGNSFNSSSLDFTCNTTHVATQEAAATTGEQIWANLYSLGTIEADTHIYLYQGAVADATRARVYSIDDQTQDWWGDGHINICVAIRNFKTSSAPIIDGGYVSVYARKYGTLYDSYEVATSITSGGRNPIPLATAPDLDNTTGYKSITFTASAGNWAVGNEIEGNTSVARGIITQIDTPGATQTVHYYLIDDPQTDFNTAIESVHNNDDTGTGTKNGSAPAAQGPALASWYAGSTAPTVAFANTTQDTDDDGTAEGYGITLDCNQNTLAKVYEWIKYSFRRGDTTSRNGIAAEQYIGAEVYLAYSSKTGTISEGSDVSQANSLATGIVMSHDTTLKQILLRNVRGTFNITDVVTDNDALGTFTPTVATPFAPKKQAPLGTFAGGTFFGARGVKLTDWIVASDENKFQLTDSSGTIRERPVAITLEVTNLVGTDETTITDDRVAMFRLSSDSGPINKTEYSAYGGEAVGAATLDVDAPIAVDVPGKTTGGILRLRDATDGKEYRIRYSSWSNVGGAGTDGRFVLANIIIASADASTNTTTIVEAGAFGSAKRGDIVVNHTRAEAVSYVTSVAADTNSVTISPAIALQVPTDSIELNCIPITLVATADDVYVPIIDTYATATTASASIVYDAAIYYRVVVRNVAATTKIVPFSTDGSTTGANKSIATIRTTDTIYQ